MSDDFPTYDIKGKLHYEKRRIPIVELKKSLNAFAVIGFFIWVFVSSFLILKYLVN